MLEKAYFSPRLNSVNLSVLGGSGCGFWRSVVLADLFALIGSLNWQSSQFINKYVFIQGGPVETDLFFE